MSSSDAAGDIQLIQSIGAIPTIMRVIAEFTGIRFVCVARVTSDCWTSCAVLDQLGFGLKPGDELKVSTTLCDEVRAKEKSVFIEKASTDPAFCSHQTPKMYGFESYFSIPVHRPDGAFFGTLCGLDPLPAELNEPKIRDMLTLFADLISRQLESEKRVESAETALQDERQTAELREQFIAVLGHDLRTPLSSIAIGAETLKRLPLDERANTVLERIKRSTHRISSLIDDLVDFTRGRMGSGIPLYRIEHKDLAGKLRHVIAELESTHQGRVIHCDIEFEDVLLCDPDRIAQLLSNLAINALVHGDASQPIVVSGRCSEGLLTVSVANAGRAIPPETISRLFQPFWRAEEKSVSSGLGLGLYIASQIARSHQGTLEVTSTAELTTFTFSANLGTNLR